MSVAEPPPPPPTDPPDIDEAIAQVYTDEFVVLLPKQRQAILSQAKWYALRGGQGAAKTTAWCWVAWDRMEAFPKATHLVVGASYGQLDGGFFKNLRDLLWEHGLVENRDFVYRRLPSPRLLIKESGAVLHAWTAESWKRLRGSNVQTLILEEPQTWGPHAEEAWIGINGRLRPNVVTAKLYPELVPIGRISFNPTDVYPGHWLHNLVEGRWKEEGYECVQMSTRDNSLLLEQDPGYVRNLEIGMDPSRWAVEIDGEYPTAGGGVYRNFSIAVHGNPPDTIPPVDYVDMTKPVHLSFDFNVALMCATISQAFTQKRISAGYAHPPGKPSYEMFRLVEPGWQRRILRVLGEICIEDGAVENVIGAFLKPMALGGYLEVAQAKGVVLFGDPSGNNRQQNADANSSARTNWRKIETMLIRALGRNKVRKEVPIAPPSIEDRVNETNAQLYVGDGLGGTSPGMTVNVDACPYLCKDFQQVKRAKNGRDIEKKPGTLLTHVSDALGYNVYRIRTLWREDDAKRKEVPLTPMAR